MYHVMSRGDRLPRAANLLTVLALAAILRASAAVPLIPGIEYYRGDENLTGAMVFLLDHNYVAETNSESAASIYELDPKKAQLRSLTNAPNGLCYAAEDGTVVCVVYHPGKFVPAQATNTFIFLSSSGIRRTVSFEVQPKQTYALSRHVFFVFEESNGDALLDYDPVTDRSRQVVFPEAGQWQYEDYGDVFAAPGQTNIVRFYYKRYGRRIRNGNDCAEGYYDLELSSGRILGPAVVAPGEHDGFFGYKSADGRYVFFKGSDSADDGYTLVSSPLNQFDTEQRDPKGKNVKKLHTFSRLRALTGGPYHLSQMSPDRHYALVCFDEPVWPKFGMLPGSVYTYYLVDVATGKTRLLMKDDTETKTATSASPLYWINTPE